MSEFNKAFQATAKLTFNYRKTGNGKAKKIDIDSARIQYIMLKYSYECVEVLPIVYVSMKLPLELHDKILGTYQTSTFNFKLTKKNGLSDTATGSNTINDEFEYVSANTNVNQSPTLNDNGKDDKSYIVTSIGMVSKTMSENLRMQFSGNYTNTNTKDLINEIALKGLNKVIMSPIQYNTEYPEFQVSSLNTRYKMIKYVFDENPFFDTFFTFFMDFGGTTYLIAKDGKPVKAGGKPEKCIINVTDVVDTKAFASGNKAKKSSYNIYVSAANVDVKVNEGQDKNVNKVVAYGYGTGTQSLYVGGSKLGSKDKAIYDRTNNAAAVQNEISNSKVRVDLFKSAIDSSILTPNKVFEIKHLTNNRKYNGKYILSEKSESYTPMGGENFSITTSASFKLIENITKAESTKNKQTGNRFDPPDKTSTADGATGIVTKADRSL